MYNPHPLLPSYMIIATITAKQSIGKLCTPLMGSIQRTRKQANHISICSTKPMQKRQSFKPIAKNIAPYIQPKDRKNLPVIRNIEIEINNFEDMLSKNANTVWAIARRYAFESGTDQCVPSWTGFFYEVSDLEQDKLHESHSVSYLQPSINLQQGQHVFCLHKFFVVC